MTNQPANETSSVTSSGAAFVLPDRWPGAFGVYQYSKKVVMRNFSTVLTVFVGNFIISFALRFVLGDIGELVSFLIGTLFDVALLQLYFAGTRNKDMEIDESFKKSSKIWLKMIGLNICMALIAIASMIALVVPFFFVLPRIILAPYYLVDHPKTGVIDSIRESWVMTKGSAQKIWAMIGVFILMVIPIITIVGIVVTAYLIFMYGAAFTVLYEFLVKNPFVEPEN